MTQQTQSDGEGGGNFKPKDLHTLEDNTQRELRQKEHDSKNVTLKSGAPSKRVTISDFYNDMVGKDGGQFEKQGTLVIPKLPQKSDTTSKSKFERAVKKISQTKSTIMSIKLKNDGVSQSIHGNKLGEDDIDDKEIEEILNDKHHHLHEESAFDKTKNDEWKDFEHRRQKDLLKPLPKIQHRHGAAAPGHGHGGHGAAHGHGGHSKPFLIIPQNHTYKFYWDVFILVLAIFICYMLPVEIAFTPPWGHKKWWKVVEYMIEGFFSLDVIAHFNTSIYDHEGNEEFTRKDIAIHYLTSSHFWIDMLSTIPIPVNNPFFKLLPCLKVIRITSLSKIIKKLDVKDDVKALIKALQLVFYLLLYLHMKGCILYYICKQEKVWNPPNFWSQPNDLSIVGIIYEFKNDIPYQYWEFFYQSVIFTKGNETGPRTDTELIFFNIVLTIDLIIAANIFGNVAVLVQAANRRQAAFQAQIDQANTAMQNMIIPHDIQTSVRDYLIFIQATQEQQEELDKFLTLISPSLKQKVAISIFSGVIKQNKKFKKLIDLKAQEYENKYTLLARKIKQNASIKDKLDLKIIKSIVVKFSTQLSQPEDVVIQQFDDTDSMYFIAKGECSVHIIDEKKRAHRDHKILRVGDYFGEISMIYGCKRSATVTSRKYSTLARLEKEQFKEIATEYPEILEILKKDGIYKYSDRMKKFMLKTIERVDYFQDIGDDALHEILYSLQGKVYEEDEILQQPGDASDVLYFLQDGVIECYTSFEQHNFILEKLFRGSIINFRLFFMVDPGQIFLKFGRKSILQELPIKRLEEVAKKYPILEEKFLKFQKKILLEGKQYALDYIMNLPKDLRNNDLDKNRQQQAWSLQIRLKNVVMRRIIEIRNEKAKPGLKDMIMESLKKKYQKDEKIRDKMKRKVMELYEEQVCNTLQDHDLWFNRIVVNIDRVLKILAAQTTSIDSVERKINSISSKVQPSHQNQNLTVNNQSMVNKKDFSEFINLQDNDTNKDMFDTVTLGNFPRIEDDHLSSSSDEERQKRERIEMLSKLANQPKDLPMVQEYRLPILTAQADVKFEIEDSSENEGEDQDGSDENQNEDKDKQ